MEDHVGLFGGSFNPIHIGHMITARAIAESLQLTQICFIPCARPPHKWPHELATMEHRLEMTRLAVAGEEGFLVSDVEAREDRLHYPIHAIESLQREMGASSRLCWIIGCDAVRELWNWHRLGDMLDSCDIVIATRAGVLAPELAGLDRFLTEPQARRLRQGPVATPNIEVSATQIRQRVRERRSIRYLVAESVSDYIDDWGLYQARTLPDQ